MAEAQHCVQVVTDHKNLIYFSTTGTLNRRQARWSTFLADYDFEIIFRPGGQHEKANALSRRAELALRPGDAAYAQQSRCLLKTDQLHIFATCILQDDSLLKQITDASMTDAFANEVRGSLQNPSHGIRRTLTTSPYKMVCSSEIIFFMSQRARVIPGCCGNATMTRLPIILRSQKPSS